MSTFDVTKGKHIAVEADTTTPRSDVDVPNPKPRRGTPSSERQNIFSASLKDGSRIARKKRKIASIRQHEQVKRDNALQKQLERAQMKLEKAERRHRSAKKAQQNILKRLKTVDKKSSDKNRSDSDTDDTSDTHGESSTDDGSGTDNEASGTEEGSGTDNGSDLQNDNDASRKSSRRKLTFTEANEEVQFDRVVSKVGSKPT